MSAGAADTVGERGPPRAAFPLGDDVFRSLIEALPVGIVLADPSGAPLYVNAAFEEIAGYGLQQIADGTWQDVVEPEHRGRGLAAWRQVIETGQSVRQQFRTTRKGKTRTVESMIGPMRGPNGDLRGFVVMVEDLTAQSTAREALRESEDRFRAIFENAGVGLVLAVGEGDIVGANRAYARFLGYPGPQEIAGRNVREFLHPEDRARAQQMRNELRSGRITRYEVERQYLRRDGTYVWGRSTVTRVADSPLIIAVVQDIDARKRAEDAVRALSGRFLRLQDEERRRIARSLHESAAQTVAALAMNLARMERMSLPPHAAETLADSLELVTQCSREIRTLSHLLHPPLLEEAGLPSSLRWYVEGFAQRSSIEVELQIADDLGRLPMELEITFFRIVQESLTNVHRHSGSRSASIRLRRSGPEIVLEVEDQGVGIPAEVLERVRTQSAATVGVGIAGMRERLSQLGGTLEIAAASPGTLVRARIQSEK
ncbi:MAG: PAS domain S-box protein [Myxococcales bacterium]|nr:PAS domain S-box protein [Myxococcales bacterium]